jgi:hypothetical protein
MPAQIVQRVEPSFRETVLYLGLNAEINAINKEEIDAKIPSKMLAMSQG